MPHRNTASLDLPVLLFTRWKTLTLVVGVFCLVSVGVSLVLPAEHRATATLVPVSEGRAAALFPVTVPESILSADARAFSPDNSALFDQILIALSAVASTGSLNVSEATDNPADFRLNYVDKEGRRFIELVVAASSVEHALAGLEAWLTDSDKEALDDLDSQFRSLVSRRLRDTEYRYDQKLTQETNELLIQKERLRDELSLVSGLLEKGALAEPDNDLFLFYPERAEDLFAGGLAPYLLGRDRLQARKTQLNLQLDQLEARLGGGIYLPGLADLAAQVTSLRALDETFSSWVSERADRSLLRFSERPAVEPASVMKRSVLFGAGGLMLGLLVGLIWLVFSEAVRMARGRAE